MKRPKYVLGRVAVTGKFSQPADEPPADPGSGEGGSDPKPPASDKKYSDADVNKIAAKHKAEGKAAAEKALAERLGVTVDEAAEIIRKHREAEDATKSEAERERAAAAKEREAAEAAKREAAAEIHEARVERALASSGFVADDSEEGQKKLARVRRMVTVAVGSSYDEVLADVQDAKKDFPELFGESKTPEAPSGSTRKLPSSDPAGRPTKPTGGEDAYAAGQKRFEERKKARSGYNPFAKKE